MAVLKCLRRTVVWGQLKKPFLTKWQINTPLGHSLRYSQDITLGGNKSPSNFASLRTTFKGLLRYDRASACQEHVGKMPSGRQEIQKDHFHMTILICRLRCQNKQIQTLVHLHCILMTLQQSLSIFFFFFELRSAGALTEICSARTSSFLASKLETGTL